LRRPGPRGLAAPRSARLLRPGERVLLSISSSRNSSILSPQPFLPPVPCANSPSGLFIPLILARLEREPLAPKKGLTTNGPLVLVLFSTAPPAGFSPAQLTSALLAFPGPPPFSLSPARWPHTPFPPRPPLFSFSFPVMATFFRAAKIHVASATLPGTLEFPRNPGEKTSWACVHPRFSFAQVAGDDPESPRRMISRAAERRRIATEGRGDEQPAPSSMRSFRPHPSLCLRAAPDSHRVSRSLNLRPTDARISPWRQCGGRTRKALRGSSSPTEGHIYMIPLGAALLRLLGGAIGRKPRQARALSPGGAPLAPPRVDRDYANVTVSSLRAAT